MGGYFYQGGEVRTLSLRNSARILSRRREGKPPHAPRWERDQYLMVKKSTFFSIHESREGEKERRIADLIRQKRMLRLGKYLGYGSHPP